VNQPDFSQINQTLVDYLLSEKRDPSKLRWLTTQITRLRTDVQRQRRNLVIDKREEAAAKAGRKWVKSLTKTQRATLERQGYKFDVD